VTVVIATSLFSDSKVSRLWYLIPTSGDVGVQYELNKKLAQTRGENLIHAVPPELYVEINFDAPLLSL
jgi:hypothetical protein